MAELDAAAPSTMAEEFRSLLRPGTPGLKDRCEQRFALRLLINNCVDLKEDRAFEKEAWVNGVTTTVSEENLVRAEAANIIKRAYKTAPWSLALADLNTPQHAFSTMNEVFICMKKVVSQLNSELSQAEADGVDLAIYEVQEMLPVDSGEEDDAAVEEAPARRKPGRKPRVSDASSSGQSGASVYGASRKWTDAEFLNLLRCVRDNFAKSWDARLKAHNDSYIIPNDVKEKALRTKEGMRQKILMVIGLTPEGLLEKVNGKIEELESTIGGD